MVSWIVYILLAVATNALLLRSTVLKIDSIKPHFIAGAFILKLGVGFVFYWVYAEHYQTGNIPPDAIRYVNDANSIAALLPERPDVFNALYWGYPIEDSLYDSLSHRIVGWQSGYLYGLTNDCATIIRLNVPIALLSRGFFPIHALIFSFLSFLGLIWLFKAFAPFIKSNALYLAFFGLFLMPTPLFWTSAPTKEAALMPVFGGFLLLGSLWYQNKWKLHYWGYLCVALAGLIFIKQYVLFALLPGVIFLLAFRIFKLKSAALSWSLTMLACYLVAQSAHHFFIGGDFLYVLGKKLTDFTNVARIQNAGSFVYVPHSNNTFEFLQHFPQAFALTYFRPYLWECKSFLYLPFILENLLLLFVMLRVAIKFAAPTNSARPIFWFGFGSVLALAAIVGNTVPILGAVIRYRTPGLLLMWLLCIMICQVPKAIGSDESN